jgi:hypothetical protein
MTDRLRELAVQAGLKKPYGSDTEFIGDFDWRDFAKLVINECASLQHRNIVVGGVSEYNRGRRELVDDIKQHFGVQ